MSYANNKGADQPAHQRSLISAFVVRCLDSVMYLVFVTKISSLVLASVDEKASWSLTWSGTLEDTFSHDEVHCISYSSQPIIIEGRKRLLYEPPREKTNKMTVRPAKTQISLGIHPV